MIFHSVSYFVDIIKALCSQNPEHIYDELFVFFSFSGSGHTDVC